MRQSVVEESSLELHSRSQVVAQINLIAEIFPSGVLAVDQEGRILLANAELRKMFGYEVGELVGRPIETLVPKHLHEKHVEHRSKFFQAPTVVPMGATGCLTGRHKNGDMVYLQIGLTPMETSDGPIVLCATADVTAQKELERKLNDILALEKAILDTAGYGVISTSVDGIIQLFSPAAEQMLGYTAEELIGKANYEILHDPEELAARAKELSEMLGRTVESGFDMFAASLDAGISEDRDWTYTRKDGARLPVFLSVTVVHDPEGNVTGYVGIVRDITKRVQAEQQSRHILEATPSGVLLIDDHCRITLINREIERIFGYRREQLLGQHVNLILPEVCNESQKQNHAEFLAACSSCGNKTSFELAGRRENGSKFPVEISLRPTDSQQGLYLLGCVNDITERKAVEDKLREAKEAAEMANRAKSEFLSAMSHELRTPLNAIIGFSQGLLERADRHPLNDHQKDRLEKIHRSGLHLLGLINDILDIAKVESGRMDITPTTFGAGQVLSEIHDLVMGLAREKPDLAVRVEIAPDLPPITTDREKLRQIIINLAGNAIKFTNEGSITLGIRFEDGQFVFTVADTGVGIPDDELPLVFEKFHQVRAATKQAVKGTGLGLTISKRFASLLGGTLGVTSQVGKGTTFELRLPERIPEKQLEELEATSCTSS
ncbi:MAG: PAS domain S-box protein [Pirellulales bacterium]|nr:PAS domain S-box protein [Pirellulales bacterium]